MSMKLAGSRTRWLLFPRPIPCTPRSGRRYALKQISTLVPSAMHAEPDRQACRLVSIGWNRGFDGLRTANVEAWTEIWRSRIHLVGASQRWQAIVDAAFYYLQASAHPSSLFSTAMFGLAYWPDYNYYFGHVMWDIETFAFPPFLLTSPETARALLDYRFTRLPAARFNASMQGYAGIQYPWESSADFGQESTPPDGTLLGMEQHVNLSVGLAFAQFCHASGDEEFARLCSVAGPARYSQVDSESGDRNEPRPRDQEHRWHCGKPWPHR